MALSFKHLRPFIVKKPEITNVKYLLTHAEPFALMPISWKQEVAKYRTISLRRPDSAFCTFLCRGATKFKVKHYKVDCGDCTMVTE